MNKSIHHALIATFLISSVIFSSCSRLVKWEPEPLLDTSDVVITCNANYGNKGLLNYTKKVYVHLGLITSKSVNRNDWQFVKFAWGSAAPGAIAAPAGDNKWTYTIRNIRQFFKVENDEKINNLVILFRSGECYDNHCKVLRNEDESDIYIPVTDKTVILSDSPESR